MATLETRVRVLSVLGMSTPCNFNTLLEQTASGGRLSERAYNRLRG